MSRNPLLPLLNPSLRLAMLAHAAVAVGTRHDSRPILRAALSSCARLRLRRPVGSTPAPSAP